MSTKTTPAPSVTINGETYIHESAVPKPTKQASLKGLPYVLIRTYSAGVHVGYLKKREGKEVTLLNTRRIWQWDGAASLSQLALEGVTKPQNCKFTVELPSIELTEAIEILPVSEAAKESIAKVAVWKM